MRMHFFGSIITFIHNKDVHCGRKVMTQCTEYRRKVMTQCTEQGRKVMTHYTEYGRKVMTHCTGYGRTFENSHTSKIFTKIFKNL